MEEIIRIDNITAYNKLRGVDTLHPLVTVIDVSKVKQLSPGTYNFNLYCIYLKELKCGALLYGRSQYDYEEGTFLAIGPGQVIGIPEAAIVPEPKGWALLFHPDFLKGNPLESHILNYSFFSYEINEALHVSKMERQVVSGCFHKIQHELRHDLDKHSRKLITANIELLLSYCARFYDRQFISRDYLNNTIIQKFDRLLHDYFFSDRPKEAGLPTVAYCAAELRLSANYFGDLIKKETGKTAQELIHNKIIELAKERVLDPGVNISDVAYTLGFKYPQHFTRLFKENAGVTPMEYRLSNYSRN
ncbi:helix-turn-helix domain-containing protein [Pedobacter duraquae]|uniref:AraC-like DNA-binding protein n=1 Tax=Pedobacter duraquae TaxID=425511 RepID=A0A4R6IKA1_9SPHI|nr:response regulator transcription factor [Pedobacter duraquae]TDO22490.1 AraC-like DNA-binding protein [Pedobacter duraquae]